MKRTGFGEKLAKEAASMEAKLADLREAMAKERAKRDSIRATGTASIWASGGSGPLRGDPGAAPMGQQMYRSDQQERQVCEAAPCEGKACNGWIVGRARLPAEGEELDISLTQVPEEPNISLAQGPGELDVSLTHVPETPPDVRASLMNPFHQDASHLDEMGFQAATRRANLPGSGHAAGMVATGATQNRHSRHSSLQEQGDTNASDWPQADEEASEEMEAEDSGNGRPHSNGGSVHITTQLQGVGLTAGARLPDAIELPDDEF
ncbi:hypothetical protein WJX72_007509 [[Myrmecia] bisecta]|uniref:Uncharacterized protein n=1 Tax=[Myrmecia] bisecta TaxID=41462 RepID=A0AAW1R8K0_9CHLO